MSAESISQKVGAEVIYHTGAFNAPKNLAIGVGCLAGLTLFVVGILTLLHTKGVINWNLLNTIPADSAKVYTLVGAGFVVFDGFLFTFLAIKHFRTKRVMERKLKDDYQEAGGFIKGHFEYLNRNPTQSLYSVGCLDQFMCIAVQNRNQKTLHLFRQEHIRYYNRLEETLKNNGTQDVRFIEETHV